MGPGNCFCLMFMYREAKGSPVCSGGRGDDRWMMEAHGEKEGMRPRKETEKEGDFLRRKMCDDEQNKKRFKRELW